MSEAKHTPGPWRHYVDEDGGPHRNIVIANRYGQLLAEIRAGTSETRLANARLMAAAPELLAALREAAHALGMAQENTANMGGQKCQEARFFDEPLKKVKRAIAAAEGQP